MNTYFEIHFEFIDMNVNFKNGMNAFYSISFLNENEILDFDETFEISMN